MRAALAPGPLAEGPGLHGGGGGPSADGFKAPRRTDPGPSAGGPRPRLYRPLVEWMGHRVPSRSGQCKYIYIYMCIYIPVYVHVNIQCVKWHVRLGSYVLEQDEGRDIKEKGRGGAGRRAWN